MASIEETLLQLGFVLPPPLPAAGNYLPYRRHGDLLYLSGVLCIRDGALTQTGAVGRGPTIQEAYAAAQVCTLNALAVIRDALVSFDRVREFIMVTGYVASVPEFAESPAVINGASDLLVRVFGDRGRHARAAVAVAGLPRNATVELAITLSVD